MTLSERCRTALAEKLSQIRPSAKWIPGYPGYLVTVEDNLVDGISPELYQSDYLQGAGQELGWTHHPGRSCPPKMHAAYSSAALVVNTFAHWRKDASTLRLSAHVGFSGLHFEAKCPTGLGGTAPHLDLLVRNTNGLSIGVESKCIEYLNGHRAVFSPSYDSLAGLASKTPYFRLIESLRTTPSAYDRLDAPQLVKHSLGLATCFPDQQVSLLYIFWEPANWRQFRPFQQHREELARFADAVSGSDVRFEWCSYSDLWADWATASGPTWLRPHLHALRQRYDLSV